MYVITYGFSTLLKNYDTCFMITTVLKVDSILEKVDFQNKTRD
jgi:hypothetical protein